MGSVWVVVIDKFCNYDLLPETNFNKLLINSYKTVFQAVNIINP